MKIVKTILVLASADHILDYHWGDVYVKNEYQITLIGDIVNWDPASVNDKTHSGVFFNRFNNQEVGTHDMPHKQNGSR